MSETYPQPQLNEDVYVLKNQSEVLSLETATVTGFTGPRVGLRQEVGTKSQLVTLEHKSNVFTSHEVAVVADDLLPSPAEGEELLLSTALEQLDDDPEKRHELVLRLAGAALGKRMNTERDMSDYGMFTVDSMVGAPNEPGSNMWKVEDLLEMTKSYPEAENTLILSRPEAEELAHVSASEALEIKDKILEANRDALNKIYEYYDVSFDNAAMYESRMPGGKVLRTAVYPSATESLYFIENMQEGDLAPSYVQIKNKAPEYSLDEGFMRVV